MSVDSQIPWIPADLPQGPVTLEEGPTYLPALCACCGRRSVRVNGFLYRGDWVCGAYFADWTEGHIGTQGMDMVLSVGGWGEGMSHHPRHMISIRCWVSDGFPQFMVLDPVEHGVAEKWAHKDAGILGALVSRETALRHPDMPEVFRLAEHVIYNDRRVNAALRGA